MLSGASNLSADNSHRDPLELALTEFTDEIRDGKSPSVDEFADRYPELANQIRELFPLVGGLEKWKSEKEVECLRRNVPKEFSFEELGEYQIVRELGRGGMGVVFQAFHVVSFRPVAIKVLPWRFAADMTLWKKRLQREASTIAALQHPNIVQVYSFSEDQGYSYYVMQLIEGVGLDKIIQQRKQQTVLRRPSTVATPFEVSITNDPWRAFARVGEQVAIALAYAHKRLVLHNDVKPSNLLVRPNGQVIVTDFGIGRWEPNELSNSDDRAVGTLRYMAPERVDGSADFQSDIYSLGVTMFELATQQPVFDYQRRSQLIAAIQNQEPARPKDVTPEIPPPFEQIIMKAMAKSPSKRYESARAVAEDLRRFISRKPIHAAEQNVWERTMDWYRGWSQNRRPSS